MKHSRAADQALAAMAVCLGLADRVVEIDRPVKTEIDRYMVQISTRFKEAQNVLKRRSKQGVVGEAVEEAGGNKVTEFWFGASHAPVRLTLRSRSWLTADSRRYTRSPARRRRRGPKWRPRGRSKAFQRQLLAIHGAIRRRPYQPQSTPQKRHAGTARQVGLYILEDRAIGREGQGCGLR